MIEVFPDYPNEGTTRRDNETGEAVGDMTYREWESMKALTTETDQSIMSDSGELWHAITRESIESVPEFTEFGSDETNIAVHNACVDILTDMQSHEIGTEKAISIPLSGNTLVPSTGGEGEGMVSVPILAEPYIAAHNHPGNDTLSFQDIGYFWKHQHCVGILAIGNNGKSVYSIIRTKQYDDYGFTAYRLHHLKHPELMSSEDDFLKGAEKYGIRYVTRNGQGIY
mgnify:CR=1 FL=1